MVDDDGANPPKSGFARKVISVARSLSRSRSPSPLRVGKTPPPTEISEEEENRFDVVNINNVVIAKAVFSTLR